MLNWKGVYWSIKHIKEIELLAAFNWILQSIVGPVRTIKWITPRNEDFIDDRRSRPNSHWYPPTVLVINFPSITSTAYVSSWPIEEDHYLNDLFKRNRIVSMHRNSLQLIWHLPRSLVKRWVEVKLRSSQLI